MDEMTRWPPPQQASQTQSESQLWMEQLNQNMLLTVQALQKMHDAFDKKFTR